MGDNQFDDLSKEAGQGMPRRRMIKLLIAGVVGGGLAKVGLDHMERSPSTEVKIVGDGTFPDTELLRSTSVVDTAALSASAAVPTALRISQAAVDSANLHAAQPLALGQLCAVLLLHESRIIATFNALIARFPQLAPQLSAARDAAIAAINALLKRFGCPGISTINTTTTIRPTTTTTSASTTTTTVPITTTTRPPRTTTTRPRTTTTERVPGTCCQVYVFGVPSCCCSDRCTTGRGRGCSTRKEFFRCSPTFFSCSFATAVSFGCFTGTCNTNTGRCPGA